MTQQGDIIAKIVHPTGGGSRDLEVIRDGHKPAPDDPLQPGTQEYDTFDTDIPDDAKTDDWIGYEYAGELTFSRVLFQEGIHFGDGGWFTALNVQVRSHGAWTNVSGVTTSPPYHVDDPNFTSYQLDFAPTTGDAIRIEGAPGGSAKFISVAELQVWAAEGTPGVPDPPMLGTDITSLGTPIANITQPAGGGNKDLSVIKQPPVSPGLTGQAALDAEYDTYTGETQTADWIGYSYAGTQFFGQLVLQAGMHFPDGGWFATLEVQVRQNGHWIPVDGQHFTSAAYPLDGSGADFATYQVELGGIAGDGIRIFGRPGGSATFVSVASLHVLAGNPCVGKTDGTACNDGDACTEGDLCMGGVCQSGPPYDCGQPDACHLRGVCQHATGLCSSPIVPDVDSADPDPSQHAACDDGNPCTVNDFCRMGTCIPGAPTGCSGPNDKYYPPLVNMGSFQGGSVAMDINNDGIVVGNDAHGHGSAGAEWGAGPGYSLGFWWSETQPGIHYIQPVGPNNSVQSINSNGAFAGIGGTDYMWHWLNVISGSVLDNSSSIVLPAAWANVINDSGQIAGRGYVPALYPGVKVFRWTPTSLDVFDDPKFAGNGWANAMDSRGTIVGRATLAADNAMAPFMT
ncbi:MAG TPA: hypothetical protein VKT80_17150, partial [Chloroflexota bacterium]|nr:hypothetical protein [Chloroflexota bacterium]